jgi:hypothetical protein
MLSRATSQFELMRKGQTAAAADTYLKATKKKNSAPTSLSANDMKNAGLRLTRCAERHSEI